MIYLIERAALEMLYHVPQHIAFTEALEIIAGLAGLRPTLLQPLLESCTSVKVKRLFLYCAREVGHEWYGRIERSRIDLGSGKREVVKGGTLDRQHPRDLFDLLSLMQKPVLDEKLRKAFIVYALSHPRPLSELLKPNPHPLEQIFQKEFAGMTREPVAIETLEEARAWLMQTVREALTEKERYFLLSCKNGAPDWALAELPEHVPLLPAVRWKLHNIVKLQKNPRKHKSALEKLQAVLGL